MARPKSEKGSAGEVVKKTLILDSDTNYLLGLMAATRGVSDSEYIRLVILESVTPEVRSLAESIRGKK